jgi:glycosyltransferase involved in cell wall biosynthesis
LKEIEIICINDGSHDGSLKILQGYQVIDNRIKIIDFKKNQSVSVARNAGVSLAIGEYIGFTDPDDYVDLDFYGKLYDFAKTKKCDIVKGEFKKRNINEADIQEVVSDFGCGDVSLHKCFFYDMFWTAIYRNSMLKKYNVNFDENIRKGTDADFLNHAVIVADNVKAIREVYYHYCRREGSLSSDILCKQKIHSNLCVYKSIFNRLNAPPKAIDKIHYEEVYRFYLLALIKMIFRTNDENLQNEICKSIVDVYKKCNSKKSLFLPQNIENSIKKKDENLLTLLKRWRLSNFYPKIQIDENLLKCKNLYIWGIEQDGVYAKYQCEQNGWKIQGFLMDNRNKSGFDGYPILDIQELLNDNDQTNKFFIIISTRKLSDKISHMCKKHKLKQGINFWISYK